MTIKVRYFARVRDALGRAEDVIEARADEDAAALIERLASAAPSAAETLRHPAIRVEINGVIGPKTAPVRDGDEVAILPPFSGG